MKSIMDRVQKRQPRAVLFSLLAVCLLAVGMIPMFAASAGNGVKGAVPLNEKYTEFYWPAGWPEVHAATVINMYQPELMILFFYQDDGDLDAWVVGDENLWAAGLNSVHNMLLHPGVHMWAWCYDGMALERNQIVKELGLQPGTH